MFSRVEYIYGIHMLGLLLLLLIILRVVRIGMHWVPQPPFNNQSGFLWTTEYMCVYQFKYKCMHLFLGHYWKRRKENVTVDFIITNSSTFLFFFLGLHTFWSSHILPIVFFYIKCSFYPTSPLSSRTVLYYIYITLFAFHFSSPNIFTTMLYLQHPQNLRISVLIYEKLRN